jgi:glucokinase
MDRYIISIDLGGTNTRVALFNSRFKIISRVKFLTKQFPSRKKLIAKITQGVSALVRDNKIEKKKILGLGIGVPGPVDYAKGKIHYLPNILGWQNTPVKNILEKKLGLKVCVDNDVNLMALAETKLGIAKNRKNVVCVTLGTGVGGGLILEGKLFRGTDFCAGEIGHMPINIHGPRCNCGGRGCLERYVGNKFVLRQAQTKLKMRNITLEKLSRLAEDGNKIALAIYHSFAENIGVALTGVVNLINPEIIVIGGGLSFAGDFIFKKIKQTIDKRAMPVQAKRVKVKKAMLGKDAGLIGAAILVRDSLSRQ